MLNNITFKLLDPPMLKCFLQFRQFCFLKQMTGMPKSDKIKIVPKSKIRKDLFLKTKLHFLQSLVFKFYS